MSPKNGSPEGTRATSPQHLPDLAHMTSQSNFGGALLSPTSAFAAMTTTSPTRDDKHKGNKRRTSQNLRAAGGGAAGVVERVGSPNSIPSSPTSVHSSSSAIFERDIEPMLSPSSTSLQSPTSPSSRHPVDPHRIPRSRNTEQLEQAVPSVLDSAAAVLATLEIDSGGDGATSPGSTMDQVSVVAPATSTLESMLGGTGRGGRSSGFASPLSFRSRSPSPLGSRNRDLLLNIPTASMVSPHTVSSTVSSPTRSPKARQAALGTSPTARNSTLSTSPMARSTSLSSSPPSAPALSSSISKDSTLSALSVYETPSLLTPTTDFDPNANATTASSFTSPTRTSTLTASSHPPSPHAATKRLSFMSYSDLLSSTPASTMPLLSLTKDARGDEPPPHIPSVSGLNLVSAAAASVGSSTSFGSGPRSGSRTPSVHGFSLGRFGTSPSPPPQVLNHAHSMGGLTHGPNKRDSIAMMDNVGGEWEREGLGMGLEERLERVGGGSVGGSLVGSPVRGVVGLKA